MKQRISFLTLPAVALFIAASLAARALPDVAHLSTPESRAAGHATYDSAGCAYCHGADWAGTERGPDLRDAGHKFSREKIQTQIAQGGGNMPAFAEALSGDQIAQLVDFLEAQKLPAKPAAKSGARKRAKP